jgi:hypothetical protein
VSPNAFAWLALYGWPFVVLGVYGARRSTGRLARTTAWMLILPVMFLPSLLELPFAGLNKHRIAFLSTAVALELFHRRGLLSRGRWHHFPLIVLIALGLGAIQTIRTNGNSLTFGPLVLPGLGWRDAAWMAYGAFVDLYLPFRIGQRVFKTEGDLRDLLAVLSICALIYAPLCLFELRFSPQLHTSVYGYFPTQFIQSRRGSGFRPVVFMNHGLSVAMFLFSGLCAATALHKARVITRPTPIVHAFIDGALVLAGRSLGSIIYSLLAVLLQLLTSTKTVARVALVLACIALAYPLMRLSGVIPTQEIGNFFGRISEERRDSLVFRFTNEDQLLARAMEKPAFGWGGWARNRVYAWEGYPGEQWAWARDSSVTDGQWVLVLGVSGFVGFAGLFTTLLFPVFRFARNHSRLPQTSQVLLGSLTLLVALFTIDLLPNAQSDFLPLVYAGAVFTLSDRLQRARVARATTPGEDVPPVPPGCARNDGPVIRWR